jgi:tetratricopeptide (TPR) repeat protein
LDFRKNYTNKKAEWSLLYNVGQSLSVLGKYQEAEQIHRQALELREKVLGREHPNTLTSINSLGSILNNEGKYDEVE